MFTKVIQQKNANNPIFSGVSAGEFSNVSSGISRLIDKLKGVNLDKKWVKGFVLVEFLEHNQSLSADLALLIKNLDIKNYKSLMKIIEKLDLLLLQEQKLQIVTPALISLLKNAEGNTFEEVLGKVDYQVLDKINLIRSRIIDITYLKFSCYLQAFMISPDKYVDAIKIAEICEDYKHFEGAILLYQQAARIKLHFRKNEDARLVKNSEKWNRYQAINEQGPDYTKYFGFVSGVADEGLVVVYDRILECCEKYFVTEKGKMHGNTKQAIDLYIRFSVEKQFCLLLNRDGLIVPSDVPLMIEEVIRSTSEFMSINEVTNQEVIDALLYGVRDYGQETVLKNIDLFSEKTIIKLTFALFLFSLSTSNSNIYQFIEDGLLYDFYRDHSEISTQYPEDILMAVGYYSYYYPDLGKELLELTQYNKDFNVIEKEETIYNLTNSIRETLKSIKEKGYSKSLNNGFTYLDREMYGFVKSLDSAKKLAMKFNQDIRELNINTSAPEVLKYYRIIEKFGKEPNEQNLLSVFAEIEKYPNDLKEKVVAIIPIYVCSEEYNSRLEINNLIKQLLKDVDFEHQNEDFFNQKIYMPLIRLNDKEINEILKRNYGSVVYNIYQLTYNVHCDRDEYKEKQQVIDHTISNYAKSEGLHYAELETAIQYLQDKTFAKDVIKSHIIDFQKTILITGGKQAYEADQKPYRAGKMIEGSVLYECPLSKPGYIEIIENPYINSLSRLSYLLDAFKSIMNDIYRYNSAVKTVLTNGLEVIVSKFSDKLDWNAKESLLISKNVMMSREDLNMFLSEDLTVQEKEIINQLFSNTQKIIPIDFIKMKNVFYNGTQMGIIWDNAGAPKGIVMVTKKASKGNPLYVCVYVLSPYFQGTEITDIALIKLFQSLPEYSKKDITLASTSQNLAVWGLMQRYTMDTLNSVLWYPNASIEEKEWMENQALLCGYTIGENGKIFKDTGVIPHRYTDTYKLDPNPRRPVYKADWGKHLDEDDAVFFTGIIPVDWDKMVYAEQEEKFVRLKKLFNLANNMKVVDD